MSNKTIKLKGKSLKGKNRIREQGNLWIFIRESANGILIQSSENENNVRWIHPSNDPDFEIIL